MRYLTVAEVLELHYRVVEQAGGSFGVRDHAALESSVRQLHQTFGGEDLYEGVVVKAAALGYFLASNHPFLDGNKRVAHAALEVMLLLNGFELRASVDEQERVMLQLAAGELDRERFTEWVIHHAQEIGV